MNAVSQISSQLSAALALDLASNVWSEGQVFQNHGIDPYDGAKLLQQKWFRQMVDEAKEQWSSIKNAKERIKLKSQVAVEQALGELFAIVSDAAVPAAARVAAFKELKDVAGVAIQDNVSALGSVPVVNIYLGDDGSPAISVTGMRKNVERDVIDVTPSDDSDDDFGMAPL